MSVLYRSPVTRWVFATVAIIAGLILAFGNAQKWRSTTSLRWLAHAPVPLQCWGLALIAYGLMILFARTRPVGYAVGAGIWAIFFISMLATITTTGPKSVVSLAALLDVTVVHVLFIRTSLLDRFRP